MADDRDILGKADALLRRHVPPRAGSEETDEVPVLTELLTPGGVPATGSRRDAPPAAAPVAAQPLRPDDAYTRELVAEVAGAVQSRLAQDLERRLAQHLVAGIQATVAATLGDLRQDIANAVGDALAEALARRRDR